MTPGADRDKVVMSGSEDREAIRGGKADIKKAHILEQTAKLCAPFRCQVKEGTRPIWWTTYTVGQKLAEPFIVEDSAGDPRVFLIGDGRLFHFWQQTPDWKFSMP